MRSTKRIRVVSTKVTNSEAELISVVARLEGATTSAVVRELLVAAATQRLMEIAPPPESHEGNDV